MASSRFNRFHLKTAAFWRLSAVVLHVPDFLVGIISEGQLLLFISSKSWQLFMEGTIQWRELFKVVEEIWYFCQLAQVARKVESYAKHWINHYPVDNLVNSKSKKML